MSNHQAELEKRINELKEKLASEPEGTRYREDLEISIRSCENQLIHVKANPLGYQFVNGG